MVKLWLIFDKYPKIKVNIAKNNCLGSFEFNLEIINKYLYSPDTSCANNK